MWEAACLPRAISGAAEVTWVVIAVRLVLGLQPQAQGGIGGGGAVLLDTCDRSVLGAGATRGRAGVPCSNLCNARRVETADLTMQVWPLDKLPSELERCLEPCKTVTRQSKTSAMHC